MIMLRFYAVIIPNLIRNYVHVLILNIIAIRIELGTFATTQMEFNHSTMHARKKHNAKWVGSFEKSNLLDRDNDLDM